MRQIMRATALASVLVSVLAGCANIANAQEITREDTPQNADEQATSGSGAALRGLDKVNGRTVDVELPTGGQISMFGLNVALTDCRYPSDNPTGEAYAFLTIREETKQDIWFEGWMIASAPALNALDHSRFDVWVLRCITS